MWEKIENTNYSVSSNGDIRNDKSGRILKQTLNNRYLKVSLGRKNGGTTVHRIVAKYFCKNPNNYDCVNHIDGNPTNNNYLNLEWCTHSHNCLHKTRVLGKTIGENHYMSYLSDEQVLSVVEMSKKGIKVKELAKMFNASIHCIRDIIKGRSRSNLTKIVYTKKYKR